ncbi:bestrophin family protein [Epibacterium sp. Ofav1-8]|uniref:bestrophin family protein n=1 Tax=Epibacterium sp. Ofav1-8 TaxID=2917735 RepID=UPI001EF6C013|nr:bestrophin family protein [Epibacterium sp. Ofav1-8]MCG7622990.1 bestrophin family protein [Epibacterium sp. Ofav1-8]
MIVRHKPGFLELLVATHGSVLPRILPRIAALTAMAALLVWLDGSLLALPHTNAAPFAVFGVALSLFQPDGHQRRPLRLASDGAMISRAGDAEIILRPNGDIDINGAKITLKGDTIWLN